MSADQLTKNCSRDMLLTKKITKKNKDSFLLTNDKYTFLLTNDEYNLLILLHSSFVIKEKVNDQGQVSTREKVFEFLTCEYIGRYFLDFLFDPKLFRTDEDIHDAVKLWCTDNSYAKKTYGNISNWDTSYVTDMSNLFLNARNLNPPIGEWDVSNVITMENMFNGANVFDQAIGQWNVGNVTNMRGMFDHAHSFNQDIGQWDVSKVTTMNGMFYSATVFNQAIGKWDVSHVTDMHSMFCGAVAFNQDINTKQVTADNSATGVAYTAWNVYRVTDMSYMFYDAHVFNKPIEKWNGLHVITMECMFVRAYFFNKPIGRWYQWIWDVNIVYKMFYDATAFDQPLEEQWELNDTEINGIFYGNDSAE